MDSDNKKYYIRVDGQNVPVSEQVYKEYQHYSRKEKYFSYDLKVEKFFCDQEAQTAGFIPSREDSYERLLAQDKQFPSDDIQVEDEITASVWMEEILSHLEHNEQYIIRKIFVSQWTIREVSAALHVSPSTVHDRKEKALKKIRKILEKISESSEQIQFPSG